MNKPTAAQQRLFDTATLIAATRLIFDRLAKHYEQAKLCDVVTIFNGQSLKKSEREEDGIFDVYGSGGLVGKYSEALSDKPFVVIGRKGSAGKPAYAPFGGWVIDTAYYAQPNDPDTLDVKYLFFALSSLDFSGDIIATAIPGINRTAIYKHLIPIPPANIQGAVSDFLDAAKSKTELPNLPDELADMRRIVARIEALAERVAAAQSLRREASEEAIALINSARNFSVGEKPNEKWLPLNAYVAEIVNGKSPDCEKRPANLDEWGVLKVGAVSFGFFDQNENKALPPHILPNPEYEVMPGDFLMCRANTKELCGACAIVGQTRSKLLLSDKTFKFVFREDNPIEKSFLNHVLKSPALRKQIEQQASGTSPTMKNISKEKVMGLLIPPFSIPEQRRLVAYLDSLQAQVSALRAAQAETERELAALMPSVLDRAFKGEL